MTSPEGVDNIAQMNGHMHQYGMTVESQAGLIGNSFSESGLNPWRWQGDTYNMNGGYGLFQFTPASGYFEGASGLAGFAPNKSVIEVTPGALPSDGYAQMTCVLQDTLHKWIGTCWRPYWDKDQYPKLWAMRQDILDIWGGGSYISMGRFMEIDNLYYATFTFLACYEGPAVPNMAARYDYAQIAYEQITGHQSPPDPPDPGPGPGRKSKQFPIWWTLRPF